MKNADKIKVHWWEDAYGRQTCHVNSGTLSFKDSLIGELKSTPAGWYYVLAAAPGERVGPFKHSQMARRALMAAAGGEELDT